MANNNKHTGPNVPALRFPEFSGEWEQHSLSDYLRFKNGLNPDAKRFGKGIKFISVMDILNNASISYDCVRASVAATEQEISDFEVEYGDVLFQRSSETLEDIGRSNIYVDSRHCVFGGFVIRGKKIGEYEPYFMKYRLDSPYARKSIIVKGAGAQHFNIGQEGLSKVELFFPKYEEQVKIGDLLRIIDDRINTQSKIIEELKTLRGALNESLYCCCESYQELSFNDVGVSYSGLSGKSGNDFGSGYPFIPYTNIFTNNIIDEGKLEYVQIREDESQNSVCFGDLLMTLSSETPEEVGIGAVYLGHESPLYLNSFAFGIHITRTDLVYPPYLSWLVSTKSFRKFILPYAQGSTRYNLQKTDFMKAKYRFPTLGRQKAISVLLSGYSSKIENEERVLNKYTALKQGLIEQLFI